MDSNNIAEQKVLVESIVKMNETKNSIVANIICKNGKIIDDNGAIDHESKKWMKQSWVLKQKIFFEMICDTKSSSKIFFIGLLFAIFSGCSISFMVVFFGRIKHILLTNEPKTELFLKEIYNQIILLVFVTLLAVTTHLGMHLSSTVLKDRIRIRLKQHYDGMHKHKYLNEEIILKLFQNVNLVEKGWETFGMQCRNTAIIISSLIICYYHEVHLALVTFSVLPLTIILSLFSTKFSKKSDSILSRKISQTIQMEKDLMLQKNCIDNIANDEYLMKLSSEIRNYTRYTILYEVWKSFHSGITSFTIFTFIGCEMLYGGYLLEMNPMIKKGDIFIVVLSMALIVENILITATYYCIIKKGVCAASHIRNLQQFDYRFMLTRYCNESCSVNEMTFTLISIPGLKNLVALAEGNSIIRFVNGTKSVLHNYHNHKLFLFIGFILVIISGLEKAAYNVIMGQIFTAMLSDTSRIQILTFCALQLCAIAFIVSVSRILSTLLIAIPTEHMAVSFHIILSRYLLKINDKQSFNKIKINTLIDENVSLTFEAKSLYHPHLSELITRITSLITNIILGFIYSWEIVLPGFIFIVLCFFVQIELEFEIFTSCYKYTGEKASQKNFKLLETSKNAMFQAINFSIIQTFGFMLKALCYTITAFICYRNYKNQAQAFRSVITLFTASQEIVQLPYLIKKIYKSWQALHQIFACMYNKSCNHCIPSISKNIKLQH